MRAETVASGGRGTGGFSFIRTASSEVYGDAATVPYHESDPTTPKTNYAVSKLVDERYATAVTDGTATSCTIVRYFNVYGRRQKTDYVVPQFVRRALDDEEVRIHGDGNQTRDFTYIHDGVNCTLKALERGGDGEIYNVGTGTETTINDLARTVVDVVRTGSITNVGNPRPYRVQRRCADISKAERELGYTLEVSLGAGIERTVERIRPPD